MYNNMLKRLTIRPFADTDMQAVIAVWKACGLVVSWNNPEEDIARKLTVDPDLFLIGERYEEIVATVMGGYEGHRGWINYLAVLPAYQHCGYGAEIMTEVENRIRAKGCPKINLQVRSSNTEVIAFYRSQGYTVDDVVSLGKRLIKD